MGAGRGCEWEQGTRCLQEDTGFSRAHAGQGLPQEGKQDWEKGAGEWVGGGQVGDGVQGLHLTSTMGSVFPFLTKQPLCCAVPGLLPTPTLLGAAPQAGWAAWLCPALRGAGDDNNELSTSLRELLGWYHKGWHGVALN